MRSDLFNPGKANGTEAEKGEGKRNSLKGCNIDKEHWGKNTEKLVLSLSTHTAFHLFYKYMQYLLKGLIFSE